MVTEGRLDWRAYKSVSRREQVLPKPPPELDPDHRLWWNSETADSRSCPLTSTCRVVCQSQHLRIRHTRMARMNELINKWMNPINKTGNYMYNVAFGTGRRHVGGWQNLDTIYNFTDSSVLMLFLAFIIGPWLHKCPLWRKHTERYSRWTFATLLKLFHNRSSLKYWNTYAFLRMAKLWATNWWEFRALESVCFSDVIEKGTVWKQF